MPQTASFYARLGLSVNLRGLVFDNLNTEVEQHEGVPILVVEGEIFNETRRIVDVPRVRFAVRNAARQEIYSWTAVRRAPCCRREMSSRSAPGSHRRRPMPRT